MQRRTLLGALAIISLATPARGIFYRPNNEDDDFRTDIDGVMSKREKRLIQARMKRGRRLCRDCQPENKGKHIEAHSSFRIHNNAAFLRK